MEFEIESDVWIIKASTCMTTIGLTENYHKYTVLKNFVSAGVFFIARADGNIEVWDFLDR